MDTIDAIDHITNQACDTCGHRAYVHAMMRNGPVTLCAHHATEAWNTLTRDAITILDLRHLLHE